MTEERVCPADEQDLPALSELMREFYAEAGLPLAVGTAHRAFERLLGHPELGEVWLLRADGEPAGYVVLTVALSMEYGGLRGFVDDLFVRERYRRRGLGGAALDAVRSACERRGVRALSVETGADNEPALRSYRRAGLVDSGRRLLTRPLAPALHEVEAEADERGDD